MGSRLGGWATLAGLAGLAIGLGILAFVPVLLGHPGWMTVTSSLVALTWAAEIHYWGSVRQRRRTLGNRQAAASPTIGLECAAYLDRLESGLRLPSDLQREIRAELEAHLADSIAGLEREGLADRAAEREALARLGNAEEMARQLRAAHQTTRRLLAGAAGGVWAAGTGAVQAYLAVFGIFLLALDVGAILWQKRLNDMIDYFTGQGFVSSNSAEMGTFTVAALSLPPAFLAGRRLLAAFARLSHRAPGKLERAAVLALVGGIAWVTIFELRMLQSWMGAVALTAIPVAFALGALVGSDLSAWLPPAHRRLAIVPALVLCGAVALGAIVPSSLFSANHRGWPYEGPTYEAMGPLAKVPCSPANPSPVLTDGKCVIVDGISTDDGYNGRDGQFLSQGWGVGNVPALAEYRDVRFEIWRGQNVSDDGIFDLDTSAPSPYATVPAVLRGNVLEFRLDLRHPRWQSWLVVPTGVGRDGIRYRLGFPLSFQSMFSGTVWDWLTASD